jgi:hypothetical protein
MQHNRISYPGHDVQCGNDKYWPMYTDSQGRSRYYRVAGKLVSRDSYEAAWNYIASRNNAGMNKRARKSGTR